jgi:hypothetical protein
LRALEAEVPHCPGWRMSFGIEISDRDVEALQTVGDVIALVKKKH